MKKITVLLVSLLAVCFTGNAQTLGDKYKLPTEAGELRTDGVYHLPTCLLSDPATKLQAFLRFYDDGTFVILHSRVAPEENPQFFQLNCNFQYVAEKGDPPFDKDFTYRSKENIHRTKLSYPDKTVLLEMDVRKDVMQVTLKTYGKDGARWGEPETFVAPFRQVGWPLNN